MTLEADLNCVVNAIDRLKTIKCRTNLPKVVDFMNKKYGFPSNKTLHLIDVLTSQRRVKEVISKGIVSFKTISGWRQRTNLAKEDSGTKNSMVVSTMLRLMLEDRDSCTGEGGRIDGAIKATLLESSMAKVDDSCDLKEVRRQIKMEVCKGTLKRTADGHFVLNQRFKQEEPSIDLDMDQLDSSESEDLVTSSSNSQTSKESVEASILPKTHYDILINNLQRSIDNVVNYIDTSKSDEDAPTETTRREISEKIPSSEITCRFPDKSSAEVPDNKRRRVIRKKTIFDPSDIESPPVPRKNRIRSISSVGAVAVREKKGKGKNGALTNGSSLNAESDSFTDSAADELEKCSDTSFRETAKDKLKIRGRPPANINKKCSICSFAAEKNQPSILSCTLCFNIAHKHCVKVDSFYKGSKKWRCEDCKIYNPVVCSSCEIGGSKQVLLMCDFCEEFFHADCHYPPVTLPLTSAMWRCSTCPAIDKNDHVKVEDNNKGITGEEEVEKINVADVILPKKLVQPSPPQPQSLAALLANKVIKTEENSEREIDENSDQVVLLPFMIKVSSCVRHKPGENIPSVENWTVDQVSDYFHDKFGQDVGDAFYAQEIDGKLLKKLSRKFVTNELGLQLGTALKVLYYVKKIQLGTNLLHQLWA